MNNDILYIEKTKLIESIVDIKDVNVIKKLRSLVTKFAKLPVFMTVNESKAEVMEAVKQVEDGKVISHVTVFAKYGL